MARRGADEVDRRKAVEVVRRVVAVDHGGGVAVDRRGAAVDPGGVVVDRGGAEVARLEVAVVPGEVAVAPGGVAVAPGEAAVVLHEAEADPDDLAAVRMCPGVERGADQKCLPAHEVVRMLRDAPEVDPTFPDAPVAVVPVAHAVAQPGVAVDQQRTLAAVPVHRSSRRSELLLSAIPKMKMEKTFPRPSHARRSPTRTTKEMNREMMNDGNPMTQLPPPMPNRNQQTKSPTMETARTKAFGMRMKVKRETVNLSRTLMQCWPRNGTRKRSDGNATTLS